MTMACGLTDWLPPAISLYYQQPLWLGISVFVAATATMVAVYFAAFGVYCSVVGSCCRWSWPLLAAAGWVAAEFACSHMLTGNPWGLLAYTQAGLRPGEYHGYGSLALHVVQSADIGGVYLTGFIILATNATLAQLWTSSTGSNNERARACIVAASVVVSALAYGHSRIGHRFTGETTDVVIVQGNVDLGYRWRSSLYGKNLNTYLELTTQALSDDDVALVLWPENAMTFFVDRRPDFRLNIAEITQPAGVELIAGGPRYQEYENQPTDYYNSAFLLAPNGEVVAVYDKQHLLPFAEYFPFGSLELLRRNFGRVSKITPGPRAAPLPTVAGKAAVTICNEVMFPHVVDAHMRGDADYILNLANDGWMLSREFAEHQLAIATARAIEQRRFLVRVSTSGPSAIVDAHGRIVTRTEPFERTTLTGSVAVGRGRTLYARLGDTFAWLCLIAAASATAMSRQNRHVAG